MRAFGALLVSVLALFAAGCGSDEMGAADRGTTVEPTPTTVPDEADLGASGVGWSVMRAQAEPPSGPPTAAKLAVFAEPARPSDSFSGSREELGLEGMPEEFRPGRQLFARSRLLIPPAEAEGYRLYGVPTEKGWVCLHLVGKGAGSSGCTRNLTEGIDYGMSGDEGLFAVYGLVADDARSVKLVAGGRTYSAVLGRNSFIFQANPEKVCPTAVRLLVLETKDRRKQELELYAPPSADDSDQAERESYFGCR